MFAAPSSTITKACVFALGWQMAVGIHAVFGQAKEPELKDYHKAIRGLDTKELRAGITSEKMFDLCVPTSKRTVGRFTEYSFEMIPGYHGLSVIAENGILKRAVVWSCTYTQTYFDAMTLDDEKRYQSLREENVDLPFERCIGRWGWDRPRMREWKRDDAGPIAAPKK